LRPWVVCACLNAVVAEGGGEREVRRRKTEGNGVGEERVVFESAARA